MTEYVERICMNLFAIRISILLRYLLISFAQFLIGFFMCVVEFFCFVYKYSG